MEIGGWRAGRMEGFTAPVGGIPSTILWHSWQKLKAQQPCHLHLSSPSPALPHAQHPSARTLPCFSSPLVRTPSRRRSRKKLISSSVNTSGSAPTSPSTWVQG